jgi:plasmid stabilization system protein ParE
MYKIRVNPNATEDLIEIRDYITEELQNPQLH